MTIPATFSNTHQALLTLLADGRFHSGAGLAARLGISRSSVWNYLHSLQDWGLELHAVSGKGYKLEQTLELLDHEQICARMNPEARGYLAELDIQPHIDSTNAALMRRATEDIAVASGTVCLAEYQSAGKGRVGRRWVSPFGSNIYLSVLWHFQSGPAVLSGLSLATGAVVADVLQKTGLTGIGLKWPNDILWQDRKLGGVLVEVTGDSQGPCTVVLGLGLNLSLSPGQAQQIDQPWVDLQSILPSAELPGRNALTGYLLNDLLRLLAGYESSGLAPYLTAWRTLDCMQGRCVQISLAGQEQAGVARGISDQGLFLLECSDGRLQPLVSGEVSLRLAAE